MVMQLAGVVECIGWSALDRRVHWMECIEWSALDGVHWMECIGWSALDGVHWMECIGWSALDGANVTTVHHQSSKRGGGIDK